MMVDLVIHFDASPETSMEREYKNLLTRKTGSVMRDNVLEGYRTSAQKAKELYGDLFRQLTLVNTDQLGQNEVGEMVTSLCLEKLLDVAKERICYVDREVVEKHFGSGNTVPYGEIRDVLNQHCKFDDREIVEDDISKVQLLPIAMLKDRSEFKFVVARKGKQATSDNSPELGKILLYFGGHVREEDKKLFNEKDLLGALHQCLFRELKEELGVDVMIDGGAPLCIWNRDGSRSDQHMAIAFVVERDLDYTSFNVDLREFVKLTKKDKYGTGTLIDGSGIRDQFRRIDSWSQAALFSKFNDVEEWKPMGELV
jgi:hypothetical protein